MIYNNTLLLRANTLILSPNPYPLYLIISVAWTERSSTSSSCSA